MNFRTVGRIAAALMSCALLLPASARAQVFNFGTMNGTGNLGSSAVFTLSGWGSVTATAKSGWDLWAKSAGTGETGLGLCKRPGEEGDTPECGHYEIGNDAGWIKLSLSLLPGVVPISFELSSVQRSESFSYKLGTSCSSLGSAVPGIGPNDGSPFFKSPTLATNITCLRFDPVSRTVDGEKEYDRGDYLLMSLTVDKPGSPQSVVPEPATMTLMGMGLVGMAGAARRRRRTA